MKKKALLIVGLALLIAAAGVAYAAWTSTLYVDARVETGFANMQWTDLQAYNNGGGFGTCTTGYADDYHTFVLRVTNGYPGFSCTTYSTHTNTGTVPLAVDNIVTNVYLNGSPWAPPAGTLDDRPGSHLRAGDQSGCLLPDD